MIGLLTKGTLEVTQVMIESKLEEMDYELRTVQVEVNESQDRKVMVCLHDSSGTFMEKDCSSMGDDNVEWEWNVSDNQEDGGEDESDNSIQEQMAAEVADMQAQNGNYSDPQRWAWKWKLVH